MKRNPYRDGFDQGAFNRGLSKHMEPVTWPPRLKVLIHFNPGWGLTAWEGQVRGVVDDVIMVRCEKDEGGHYNQYVRKWSIDMKSDDGYPMYWYGKLPKELKDEE